MTRGIKTNGAAIRVIRELSELTIADVVKAIATEGIQIHEDHLRNIELGHRQPSPRLHGAIARALHCPKAALLADADDDADDDAAVIGA